jgi:radical SAM protein with 4Fe4S-binding SPASM domain
MKSACTAIRCRVKRAELVAYARQRDFVVRVFTNGLTMTPALAAELRRLSVIDVEISLYATRADIHDFVTGVPGSFERTVHGVQALRNAGVPVTIKTLVMSINQDDLVHYPAFALALDVQHRVDTMGVMPREGADRVTEAFQPDGAALNGLELLLGCAPTPLQDDEDGRKPEDELLCAAAYELHFEANGEARPCTMLEVKLGDLKPLTGNGPLQAFESDTAREMRALRWGHLHGCRDCDLARLCNRCHASALAETGDALGPYPSACARARRNYEAAQPSPSGLRIIANGARTSGLGPYRKRGPGLFEAIDDRVTDEDHARRQQLGWIRSDNAGSAAPELAVRPGKLVQIRRPGRKASKLERVPGGPLNAIVEERAFDR